MVVPEGFACAAAKAAFFAAIAFAAFFAAAIALFAPVFTPTSSVTMPGSAFGPTGVGVAEVKTTFTDAWVAIHGFVSPLLHVF